MGGKWLEREAHLPFLTRVVKLAGGGVGAGVCMGVRGGGKRKVSHLLSNKLGAGWERRPATPSSLDTTLSRPSVYLCEYQR